MLKCTIQLRTLISLAIQSKLSYNIMVLLQYLSLVQHGLLSCDNFFLVISHSFWHSLWLYVISIN